jgi:hypothetical protein
MLLEPSLGQRTQANVVRLSTFGNMGESGPTLDRFCHIVLVSHPTNELSISKAAPQGCGQK